MWNGKYNFFDYKYNIEGYSGQDYMSPIQFIMCGLGIAAIIVLLYIFRNVNKDNSKKFLFILGVVMTSLYIFKTSWESYFDIQKDGSFNIYILPFDTCSLIMPTLIIAGLSKKDSKYETFAATFLSTIGFAGGVANMIFLRGLKYYPMFAFGGLYSYFWHLVMIFVAFYIPVTKFHKFVWKDIFNGMICLLVISVFVIPFNYIKDLDFMLLNGSGGVPFVEDIASSLIKSNLRPLATLVMLIAYLFINALMVSIYILLPKVTNKVFKKS